jgi:predicted RNase H-like nuclease (RuvC/YqgF family)
MYLIEYIEPMSFYIRMILLVGMIGCLAIPAFGKYYRYTDANGVLRFTDNLADVPKDQRPNVKTFKSIKSRVAKDEAGPESTVKAAPPSNNSRDEEYAREKDKLDRRQAELNKLFMKLQNERTALAAKAPPAGASAETIDAYRQKVENLNTRIGRYEKQRAEFEKKLKEFHAKFNK